MSDNPYAGYPTRMSVHIPLPLEVKILAEILRGDDASVQVYAVGGAVRDFLWNESRGSGGPFRPKDVDLATSLDEDTILYRLRSEEAERFGVRVAEKESVDTFGVVFASVGGRNFEVAPFRKDVGSTDGRHPERVEPASAYEDAMRRDFTINNLYYDFERGEVLDFNARGAGVDDVRLGRVRPVGDPFERFDEDKLRVLRMVRFHNRFNDSHLIDSADERTRAAVARFANLRDYPGMSGERIAAEFLAGLAQSLRPARYLGDLWDLGLIPAVLGEVDVTALSEIGRVRNPQVVLAALLHKRRDVRRHLNALKYSNDIAEQADFLAKLLDFDANDVADLLKTRDRHLIKSGKRPLTEEEAKNNALISRGLRQDLDDLGRVSGQRRKSVLRHFGGFLHTPAVGGEELLARGYSGKEVGQILRAEVKDAYLSSFHRFFCDEAP